MRVISLLVFIITSGLNLAQGEQPLALDVLVERLGGADRMQRREAARALASLGPNAAPAAAALGKAIRDRDPQVVSACLQALASLGPSSKPAMQDLLWSLDRVDGQRRYRVAHALSQMGADAIAELRHRLVQEDMVACKGAIVALGCMGEEAESCLPELVRLLEHDDIEVRGFSTESLVMVGDAAIPHLFVALESRLPDARIGILTALAKIKLNREFSKHDNDVTPENMEALIALARDADERIRGAAVTAISSMSPNSELALDPFLDALNDKSEVVRAAAVSGCINLSPRMQRAATRKLIPLLGDEDVVDSLVSVICGFGSNAAEATPLLLKRFSDDPTPDLAHAIGRIGPVAMQQLIESLSQESISAEAAACVVKDMPAKLRIEFMSAMRDPNRHVREAAAIYLGDMVAATRPVIEMLIRALNDEQVPVRLAATRSLGKIGSRANLASGELMRQMEFDPNVEIRAASVRAIGCVGLDDATLLAALEVALADASPLVRSQAILRLSKQSHVPHAFYAHLANTLQHGEDPSVRAASARAIVNIDVSQIEVATLLVRLLDDSDPQVRKEAFHALPKFGEAAGPIVKAVRGLLSRDVDSATLFDAVECLSKFGPLASEALTDLVELASATDAKMRAVALNSVCRVGIDGLVVVDLLISKLNDEAFIVREVAVGELARLQIAAAPAVPSLIVMLNSTDDAEMARRALRRITVATEAAVPKLIQIIEDESSSRQSRRYALYYLRTLGSKAVLALPILRKQYESATRRTKQEIERVINAIDSEGLESDSGDLRS